MTGWYIALALYVLGWIATTNAVLVRSDSRTPLGFIALAMLLWPGWIFGWCLVRGWKRDAWR